MLLPLQSVQISTARPADVLKTSLENAPLKMNISIIKLQSRISRVHQAKVVIEFSLLF